MFVNEIRENLANSLRDVGMEQANSRQLLTFINRAALDAGNEDWLLPASENSSITIATATYYYNVPAGFAYISQLWDESPTANLFVKRIPDHQWRLVYIGMPQIRFEPRIYPLSAGKKVKIVGQRRPLTYLNGTDVIDNGLESFLLERATAYGARFLARQGGDLTNFYNALTQESYLISEAMLQHQKDRFDPENYGRVVPLR